jgi:hypothetical protein
LEGTPTGFGSPLREGLTVGWPLGAGGVVVVVVPVPPPLVVPVPPPPLVPPPLPPPVTVPELVPGAVEPEILADGLGLSDDFLPAELDPQATVRATTPIGITSFLRMLAAPWLPQANVDTCASAGVNLKQTQREYGRFVAFEIHERVMNRI